MKLLIIGGTGFIGKNLKNYFESKNDIKVYAPTRQELDLFDDNLCFEYIKKLKPDIMFKGSDYQEEDIVGSDIIKNNGGKVILIDLLKGFSTTNIINKSSI